MPRYHPVIPLEGADFALVRDLLATRSVAATHALVKRRDGKPPITWNQIRNVKACVAAEERAAAAARDAAALALLGTVRPKPPAPSGVPFKRPPTLEEQLARVRAGARVVTKPNLQPSYADRTLGGVATGLL